MMCREVLCNSLVYGVIEGPTHAYTSVVLTSPGNSPWSAAMARSYETLEVTRPAEWVVQVQLNRPEKSNAMNRPFWRCVS